MTSDPARLDRYLDSSDSDLAYQSGERNEGASPGKRSMTQGLAPRPIVFRVESAEAARELGAAFGRRDSNGVAEHADAAVDRAASSSGSPLRSDIRDRFESSLGTDLSTVRVHTGESSAQASAAVGAKAYTVGNDVHFGAGQYQPDDPFGLHLLAHEVAHTQQQAGGEAHRQNKLEVSTPGDSAEGEADRAADAMVAGTSASVSLGSGVQRKVHREPLEQPAPANPLYDYPGKTVPFNAVPLAADVGGLYDAIIDTSAFKNVPQEDALFATLREFASIRKWQIPTEPLSTSVSTSRWGMVGKWQVTVTPKVIPPPVHRGPSGKMKVGASDSSAHQSGGSISGGAEAGGEAGGDVGKGSGKLSDGSGSSHGASRTGGTSVEQEAEAQLFDFRVMFDVSIVGGWEEGTIGTGLRVLGAIGSLGVSELTRPDQQRNFSQHCIGNYKFSIPTVACTKG
jgi:hypothetical protein